jgi:hypothetical protein
MIEAVIIISSVMLVMWTGMSFIAKCSSVKLKQEMELRRIMLTESPGSCGDNIFLQNINTFLSGTVCCEEISTEENCVKVPDLLNGGPGINSVMKFKSSIFVLKGCWNKQQLVEAFRNIQFKHGSVNDLKKYADDADRYLRSFKKQENR